MNSVLIKANGRDVKGSIMANTIEVIVKKSNLKTDEIEIVRVPRIGFKERYIDFLANGNLYIIKINRTTEIVQDGLTMGTVEEWEFDCVKGGLDGEKVEHITNGTDFIENPFIRMFNPLLKAIESEEI